jgi:hypothetical protein
MGRSKEMKKVFALMVCMTVYGAVLFAQTVPDRAEAEYGSRF